MAHEYLGGVLEGRVPVKRGSGEMARYADLPLDEKQEALRKAYRDAHTACVRQRAVKERMAERALRELGVTPEMLEGYL
jgi:hypothetical protein